MTLIEEIGAFRISDFTQSIHNRLVPYQTLETGNTITVYFFFAADELPLLLLNPLFLHLLHSLFLVLGVASGVGLNVFKALHVKRAML